MKKQKVIVEIVSDDKGNATIDFRLDPPIPPQNQWQSLPKNRQLLLHMGNDIITKLKKIMGGEDGTRQPSSDNT